MFLYYKESKDGQILEEGITEAGSMASFAAAGTAYVNYGVEMIPFFVYYSMFASSAWRPGMGVRRCARQRFSVRRHGRADHAGRRRSPTQDGHSMCWLPRAHLRGLRSAFAYEIAIIVQDGIAACTSCRKTVFTI